MYEGSELLSLQPTSPSLPLSVQSYINSLEIPTKKTKKQNTQKTNKETNKQNKQTNKQMMQRRHWRLKQHQSHWSYVSANQGTNPLINRLLPAKTSLGSSNFALWIARSIKLKVPILFWSSNMQQDWYSSNHWIVVNWRSSTRRVLSELSLAFLNYNVHRIPRGNKRSGGDVLVLLRTS